MAEAGSSRVSILSKTSASSQKRRLSVTFADARRASDVPNITVDVVKTERDGTELRDSLQPSSVDENRKKAEICNGERQEESYRTGAANENAKLSENSITDEALIELKQTLARRKCRKSLEVKVEGIIYEVLKDAGISREALLALNQCGIEGGTSEAGNKLDEEIEEIVATSHVNPVEATAAVAYEEESEESEWSHLQSPTTSSFTELALSEEVSRESCTPPELLSSTSATKEDAEKSQGVFYKHLQLEPNPGRRRLMRVFLTVLWMVRSLRRMFGRMPLAEMGKTREYNLHKMATRLRVKVGRKAKAKEREDAWPVVAAGGVSFDVSKFLVDEKSTGYWPAYALAAVNQPPGARSQEQVTLIVDVMKSLRSFKCYDDSTQMMLATAATLHRFEVHRVIVRQGHPAHSLYFIFSGECGVSFTTTGDDITIGDAHNALSRGACFGESVLKEGADAKRNATIKVTRDVELLCVDRRDLDKMGVKLEIPNDFNRVLEFLSRDEVFGLWSREKLAKLANTCKIEKYKYYSIVDENLDNVKWFYFIYSGRCEEMSVIDVPAPSSEVGVQGDRNRNIMPSALISRYQVDVEPIFRNRHLPRRSTVTDFYVTSEMITNLHLQAHLNLDSSGRGQDTSGRGQDTSGRGQDASGRGQDSSGRGQVYLKLRTLAAGDTFGLMETIGGTRPRLMLVSRGAEVIRCSKLAFLSFANNQDTKMIRNILDQYQYPNDRQLHKIYKEHEKWLLFKRNMTLDVLLKKHEEVLMRSRLNPATYLPSVALFPPRPTLTYTQADTALVDAVGKLTDVGMFLPKCSKTK